MKRKRCYILAAVVMILIGIQQSMHIGSWFADKRNEDCQSDIETMYEKLNDDILGNESVASWYSDSFRDEVIRYAESMRGEFEEVSYEGNLFPPDLVYKMEKALYSLNMDTETDTFWKVWDQILESLDGEKYLLDLEGMYQLFPELSEYEDEIGTVFDAYKRVFPERDYSSVYRFSMSPDKDNYLLVYREGGNNGVEYVELSEKADGQYVKIGEFQIMPYGGELIRYNGEFYYILLQYNINTHNMDGIRIYRLGNNMYEENILIRYLPESYFWRTLYENKEIDFGSELESYIDSIKKEITSDECLENGEVWSVGIYMGEEAVGADYGYGVIDFANCGCPIYMQKSNYVQSKMPWHIRTTFSLYDEARNETMALENMELNDMNTTENNLELVQLWFKKIAGRVLTFRIYHVSDYNYVLNVSLLQLNEVIQIRNDVISPRGRLY